jgi:hypothetical protein
MINSYTYKNLEKSEEPEQDPDPNAEDSVGLNFKTRLVSSFGEE